MSTLLDIQNLSIDFVTQNGVTKALQDVSFKVDKGEIVALVGESGSGKSITSLSILQLLPTPPTEYSSGEILFTHGNDTIDLLKADVAALQKIRGNDIAMIFQEPMTSLNPVYTCGDQVAESLIAHKKISRAAAKQQTIEWFRKVKIPEPELAYHKYPHQLSGGQKQRVMIAMAMCCEPALLICDEPTTALDVTVQQSILQLIKELQQENQMGVIFITHDLGVVAAIADRVVVMYKGNIIETGTVKEIFTSSKEPYTQALIACRPVNHQRGTRLPVVNDFLNPATQPVVAAIPAPPYKGNEKAVLLSAQNVAVWFPKTKNFFGKATAYTRAVDDVSFDIYENETLGIVGESGCGKTTLGRALLQLIPITKGSILYQEKDMQLMSSRQLRQLRKDVQIIFQDPYSSLNPRKKIGDAIVEPLYVHGLLKTAAQRKERAKLLLQKVGLLPEHYHRYPHEFSGGQRQRIVIARALALEPSFIICDESVAALDVSVQAQVLNLLNDLKKEFGFTIVFISHDLSVVKYFCDRILVMRSGKIIESGNADDVYNHPREDYTQQLIAAIPQVAF